MCSHHCVLSGVGVGVCVCVWVAGHSSSHFALSGQRTQRERVGDVGQRTQRRWLVQTVTNVNTPAPPPNRPLLPHEQSIVVVGGNFQSAPARRGWKAGTPLLRVGGPGLCSCCSWCS